MTNQWHVRSFPITTAFMVAGICSFAAPSLAQQSAPTPAQACGDMAAPPRDTGGGKIGITSCEITGQSVEKDREGRPFVRMEVAISGVADGYIYPITQGVTRKDVVDVPELIFPQFGITDWVPATAAYSGTGQNGKAGAGLTILYPDPAAKTPWNGKIYFVVHGTSNNTPMGDLVAASDFPDKSFSNLYARQMIDKGYAVIYTRRPAESGVTATYGDGKTIDESLGENVGMLLDFLKTGKKIIETKLSQKAKATYWYGHSGGVIVGRLLNYTDRNIAPDGSRYFDGFLMDDAGGGLPLPVSQKKGDVLGQTGNLVSFNPKDLLFGSATAKKNFTKEINLSHGAYLAAHDWLPNVIYITYKRQNALLIHQQGLDDKSVMYEISGASHVPNTTNSSPMTLDMGGIVDASIDLLDKWVQNGVAPPPTISKLSELGIGGKYAAGKTSAVDLPPMACPTGVRYFFGPAPKGTSTQTGYAAFDGKSPEPVDSRGFLIDVNGDGYRDTMPSIDAQWSKLGLIKKGATVDKKAYSACVEHAAAKLEKEGLLTKTVAKWYVDQAGLYPNIPW